MELQPPIAGSRAGGDRFRERRVGLGEPPSEHEGRPQLQRQVGSLRGVLREKVRGAAEQVRGSGGVAPGVGTAPRSCQPLGRLAPERGAVLVGTAELFPVLDRLFEVIAEDLLDFDDVRACPLLDQARETLVEERPLTLRNAVVRRVADELVAEPVTLLPGHDGQVRNDEVLTDEKLEIRLDRVTVAL